MSERSQCVGECLCLAVCLCLVAAIAGVLWTVMRGSVEGQQPEVNNYGLSFLRQNERLEGELLSLVCQPTLIKVPMASILAFYGIHATGPVNPPWAVMRRCLEQTTYCPSAAGLYADGGPHGEQPEPEGQWGRQCLPAPWAERQKEYLVELEENNSMNLHLVIVLEHIWCQCQ